MGDQASLVLLPTKYHLLFPSGASYSEHFVIYIQKSHLNDSDLFSWQFEDVTAIQSTFAG